MEILISTEFREILDRRFRKMMNKINNGVPDDEVTLEERIDEIVLNNFVNIHGYTKQGRLKMSFKEILCIYIGHDFRFVHRWKIEEEEFIREKWQCKRCGKIKEGKVEEVKFYRPIK